MCIFCSSTNIISEIESYINDSEIKTNAQAIINWRNEQSLKSNAWDDVAYMIFGLLDKLADRLDKMPEPNQEEATKLVGLAGKLGNISDDKIIDGILKFHNKEN